MSVIFFKIDKATKAISVQSQAHRGKLIRQEAMGKKVIFCFEKLTLNSVQKIP